MFKLKLCSNWALKCLNQAQGAPFLTLSRTFKQQTMWGEPQPHENRAPKPISNESEQDCLVRAKLDPDHFGKPKTESEELDEGDIQEERDFTEQPSLGSKLSTKKYADIIKNFIRQRRIKEAIDVLEVQMLKEDRVKPEGYIYSLLLGACGRVGYTKKAFMLFNNLKKRGITVHASDYTALFNACSNSPWPTTDGIDRARKLYDNMIEKGYQPNETNYNAMIKAFGRGGDMAMAFALVDEMQQKGFPIKDSTINFLLQSCISDSEAGFRHSLLIWRKLVEKNIKPNLYTFNLLLRCVRDCGLGDSETMQTVIETLIGGGDRLQLESSWPENDRLQDSEESAVAVEQQCVDLRPDLLAVKPHLGSVMAISEVKTAEDRLILLGGCKGFLDTVTQYKCTPDIKTFTLLLDCIPNSLVAEKELLRGLKKLNVEPDLDFYNILMKKRLLRADHEGAQELLQTLKQSKMRPNVMTYGILALGCQTGNQARALLKEMSAAGYTLNTAILGAMLKQACITANFQYVFDVMELCLEHSVPVDQKMLDVLKTFKKKCGWKRDKKEMSKREVEQFRVFNERYKAWLTEVQIDASGEAHPWQQFRQHNPENEHYKGKDSRFEPRRLSRFKVKTSKKHLRH